VRADAEARGARRAALQADVLDHLSRAAAGTAAPAAVAATVAALDELARLEGWRLAARLTVATGQDDLWPAVDGLVHALLAGCGDEAPRTREWIRAELDRIRA
jgi:hypothetical protein